MFTSSRGASHDRRGQRSSSRKSDLSSRVSLLSGTTTPSSSSSGSGSTITQESVSRSRRAPRSIASLRQNQEPPGPLTITRRQSTGSSAIESSLTSVDVFAFLEHDPSIPFIADSNIPSHNAVKTAYDSTPPQEESDLDCSTRSLHSDSGISVRDSSPEPLHHRSYSMSVLDPLREEDSSYSLRRFPLKPHQYLPKMLPGRDGNPNGDVESSSLNDGYIDSAPEAFYRDHTKSNGLPAAGSVQAVPDHPTADFSGYDLLAARLANSDSAEHPFKPLYRKFTRLNHRILLQLQDEISQMEEDLAGLDAADARVRRSSTGEIMPESRRLNLQWHGSELHARRFELLGQIYVKVEQYSKSLSGLVPIHSS
jgi:hypothetical protein